MPITYPLTLPTITGISSINIRPFSVVAVAESPFTLSQQVQEYAGQRWEADVTLPIMSRAEAEEWNAFFLKLNGRRGTFLMGDPAGSTPRGVATGTPLVKGAGQTGNTLITDGWTTSTANILRAGDYVQLGTGSNARLHKNLDDVNSDSSGNATLTLWPNIITAPTDNAALTITAAKGVWRLSTNVMEWNIFPPAMYQIAFTAMEAL
jgi:hypothetical protein